MRGVRPSFWSRLGLGTLPGEAEETRAFLQKRIAFYLGLIFLLWLTVAATSMASTVVFMPELLSAPDSARAGLVHNAGTLGLLLCWLACRFGKRSLVTLSWMDGGVTIGQAIVMSAVMDGVDIGFRPDLNMSLGLACTLIARAAVVPSNGFRTLGLGVLSALPLLVATWFTHSSLVGNRGLLPPVATIQVATWLIFMILVSTIISRVIYGLSQQIRAATRLGQYTLERKIGEGAMGVVYLARHALLRRPTAIKLLAVGSTGARALERFEREVQSTSALRHPNTVAIYDYGHTPEGVFYYAMEYLDGVDLERLLTQHGPLPEGRVVHVLRQVAGALAEAHAAGLVHRDIKPSNVLLCDHGQLPDFAKVVDFGLVKDAASPESSASSVASLTGTPLYMSPEAITTPTEIDARSDLYALGALGYALLTGGPPFSGRTAIEVLGHHLHSPVEPPSRRLRAPVSAALEALLLDCLAKHRDDRPASATQVGERLEGCAVDPWTTIQARAWWTGPGASLRQSKLSTAPSAAGTNTIAIDLHARA